MNEFEIEDNLLVKRGEITTNKAKRDIRVFSIDNHWKLTKLKKDVLTSSLYE